MKIEMSLVFFVFLLSYAYSFHSVKNGRLVNTNLIVENLLKEKGLLVSIVAKIIFEIFDILVSLIASVIFSAVILGVMGIFGNAIDLVKSLK